TLPAEDVVGRVPPRRALEVALAHEELEEEWRLVELPATLRMGQDPREQLVGALPTEEVLLVGRLRVTVPGRDHHALDAEVHHRIEELARAERVGAIEEGGVGRDPEAPPERDTDGAPHSSTAPRHCSTVSCFLRICAGYWILPQPAHARLQRKRGSSIRTSG